MTRIAQASCLVLVMLVTAPIAVSAQNTENEQRWSFSQRFQGTSNSAGLVMKTNSTVFYRFNRHVEAYGGLPVYFAKEASTNGPTRFMTGIGNAYSGLLVRADTEAVYYVSDLIVTAPTGDRTRGFSTGEVTVDWTNTLSHSFGRFTPFGSIGVANTISDTSFFVRPFSSKGVVAHFEAGALVDLSQYLSVGGSGYGVRAKGEQQMIIGRRQETTGPLEIVNDHGFATWFSVRPASATDFHIGYSRSATYKFDSLFFGVGVRFGR